MACDLATALPIPALRCGGSHQPKTEHHTELQDVGAHDGGGKVIDETTMPVLGPGRGRTKIRPSLTDAAVSNWSAHESYAR